MPTLLTPNLAFIGISLLLSTVSAADRSKLEYLEAFLGMSNLSASATYDIPMLSKGGLSEVSLGEFESIVRRGIPTVIRGVASGWSELRGLSCADYSRRWPDSVIRAEYTDAGTETFVQLGNQAGWLNATRAPADMHSPSADCDDEHSKESRPVLAPYVLHVKDRVKASIKKEIGNMYPGLPFSSPLLDTHIRDSMEFWFQHVGAGTFAHNDAYCHSVFSVQLRGSKRWRLMLVPSVDVLSRDIFDEFDSGIYDSVHAWEPDFEVTLAEGDGILFPPGFMHETRTLEGPSLEDTCGTSVTFNIPLPMPASYIRTFLPRFSVSRELHQCMGRWESFATLNADPVDWDPPKADSQQPAQLASEIFSRIDINGDGVIGLDEVEKYCLTSGDSTVEKFRSTRSIQHGDIFLAFSFGKSISAEMADDAMRVRAADTMAMWDLNEDGIATREEVVEVLSLFQYYVWRQQLVDKAVEGWRIGSDVFRDRLELVERIMLQLRPEGAPEVRQRGIHETPHEEL